MEHKIGVCVRYDANNYGSMLQILATGKILERYGYTYEFIRYNKRTLKFIFQNVPRVLNPYYMRGVRMSLQKKFRMKQYPEINQGNRERLQKFQDFRDKYYQHYSPVYKGYDCLVRHAENYAAIMVGSDQLWTPAGISSKFYNLLFVPDHIRKISFATSFGVSAIPRKQQKLTSVYLNRINFISVRELQGRTIIKKLTGRIAFVALDPTLLFTCEQWINFIPYTQQVAKPYIFCYFLGKNPIHREETKKLARKLGLWMVTIPHMDEFVEADVKYGDEQRYCVGPEEFLNLIRGAEYICTDSYHGTIFSILNRKKFLTFERFSNTEKQSRNSRISTLFEITQLHERQFSGNVEAILGDINYKRTLDNIMKYRAETYAFLDEAFRGLNKQQVSINK